MNFTTIMSYARSRNIPQEVTFKGKPRMKPEEICVFHAADGKIVSEQFFY
jgi:hypothetical protein